MVGSQLWAYLCYPMAVTYLTWALVWGTVGWYYLSACQRQWRIMFPEYKSGRVTLMATLLWRIVSHSIVAALRGKINVPLPKEEHRYPTGMLLQHGVVCSSLCSAALGLSSWTVDRSTQSLWFVALIVFAITLSTLGGLLHLYPPMRNTRVGLWRLMVLLCTVGAVAVYGGTAAMYLLA